MKENNDLLTSWKNIVTIVLRIIVGITFIFSGFVKAIDPWGTVYKFHDYLAAMNFVVWDNLVLIAVFLLFSVEFIVGVFLLIGCDRRLTPILSSMIMIVMLPLTLWVAIADPVSDCGCFGDALIISNWATFWKNLILSAMIGWLLKYNHKSRYLVIPELHWLVFLASAFFINVIGLFGYVYQPLLDFRPYKIGELLVNYEEETEEFEFIYSKDGKQKSFTADNIPTDDGWEFVERKLIQNKSENPYSVSDKQFVLYEEEEDMTQTAILSSGEQMILFYPSLTSYSIASTYQINSLQEYCNRNEIDMIAVVAGSKSQIDEFVDLSMATYPIYTSEDTSIKEIVRGCPAIVYLKEGIIVWKSTLRAINNDNFSSIETETPPEKFVINNKKTLHTIVFSYLCSIIFLIFISHIPKAVRYAKQKVYFKKFVKNNDSLSNNDKNEVTEKDN